MTKERIKYYMDVESFNITGADYAQVDDKRFTEIDNMAIGDIENNRKKRTRADFKNESEYKFYIATIYEQALRLYYGMGIGASVINE